MSRDIYIATKSFLTTVDGVKVSIRANETCVRDGHDLLDRFSDRFKKLEPRFETTSVRRNGTRRKAADEPELEVLDSEA